ncbi:hypothetical protein AB0H43_22360 [Hamadaea sp. NPDC050747]|uniref:hypothetical protein n=1 Tax=Hamadaea sp. NPDC050747 TaxID=3155789 RepID=UPI0034104F50
MRTGTRLLAVLATGLLGVAGMPSIAHAADVTPDAVIVCDPGTTDMQFNTTSSVRTLTHDKYYSVPAGGSIGIFNSITKIATITASVSYSTSATVSASVVIGELSGTVGVTLAASGTYTSQTTESVTYHAGPGQYAAWHGFKKFSGNWSGYKCNTGGTAETYVSGSAVSWGVAGEGVSSCSGSYSSSSWEYKAVAYAC